MTADVPSALVPLAAIFSDGDDFRRFRERIQRGTGTGLTDPIFSAHSYDRMADRIEDLELKLAGISTGYVSPANAGIGIFGSVSEPWIRPTNGGTASVEDAGFYRAGVREIGYGVENVETVRFGTEIFAKDGAETDPIYSFQLDSDSGFYRRGNNDMEWVTGGTAAIRVNSLQQRTSATQGRAKGRSTGDTINSSATPTAMPFAAADEDYDVGGYHSDTNNTRWTVPNGHDGNFKIWGEIDFDDGGVPAGGTNRRRVELFLNGTTVIAAVEVPVLDGELTVLQVQCTIDLVATDFVELRGLQDTGTNLTSVDTRFAIDLHN